MAPGPFSHVLAGYLATDHGPLGRVLLGSVGERLLSGAPCAIAIAPRGYAASAPHALDVIAVAFDGSPEARGALRVAHALARRTGAALGALTVVVPPAAIPGRFVPLPGLEPLEGMERPDALARQELAATRAVDAAIQGLGDGVTVEQQVLFGTDPVEPILEAAASDVDLLVLGSRGYGPVRRALVGSVSSALVRHAPCPVLVMPRLADGAD